MNQMIVLAISLVIIAYILYSISIFTEKLTKRIKVWMVIVFGIAFICDSVGTTLMGLSADTLKINLHTICGYIALAIMAIHFVLSIIAIKYRGYAEKMFSKYSIYAWVIWSCAFFTGIP